jgi:hypothetical protein
MQTAIDRDKCKPNITGHAYYVVMQVDYRSCMACMLACNVKATSIRPGHAAFFALHAILTNVLRSI